MLTWSSDFLHNYSSDLTALAKEGVLWLNTSLTVRAANANSHSKIGWDQFTRAAMQAVLSRPGQKGVVFIAWGAHAQKAVAGFDAVRKESSSFFRIASLLLYCCSSLGSRDNFCSDLTQTLEKEFNSKRGPSISALSFERILRMRSF